MIYYINKYKMRNYFLFVNITIEKILQCYYRYQLSNYGSYKYLLAKNEQTV